MDSVSSWTGDISEQVGPPGAGRVPSSPLTSLTFFLVEVGMETPHWGVLTSMFLQATFFTTAGNRSEAFFPRAIIWMVRSRSGEKEKGGAST